ncbi:MAG TPA: type II toxin-antitoxin system RelE/ParE family toxin [Terriglobia bacterium]|nr:type II toxin-antitoxin system RelE/ParE family toxin [Terriglobia bacterium]
MTSANKKWVVAIARPAQKSLKRIPLQDQVRIREAIDEMEANPFQGDVRKLKGDRLGFRRRVGDWRIFFDPYPDEYRVVVTGIERRTSTTY